MRPYERPQMREMQARLDPVSRLWCRSDGAILMPPAGRKFKKFRWAFGTDDGHGYKAIRFRGTNYKVHRIICRAFHGLCPVERPEVDHINRCPSDNRPDNLRWAGRKENCDNQSKVDQALERYKVRCCEDVAAYARAYRETHPEKRRAWSRAYYERHKV